MEFDEESRQQSVENLIRALVRRERAPIKSDIERIRVRLGIAPFNEQSIRVPIGQRGLTYLGRTVQARDESAFVHLVRRVVLDRQWANGTSIDEYVADLRQLVALSDTMFVIYDRGQGPIVGAFGPNRIPVARRGDMYQPYLYVVYSADRGSIITGYQVSGLNVIDVSDDPLWLA
jgi:hypothetical protein